METTILDLPIEDIIYKNIFTSLTFEDLFIFSQADEFFKNIVTNYFKHIKALNFPRKFNESAIYKDCFTLLLENWTSIRVLNLINCKWITDSHLKTLFLKNNNLEKISILRCEQNTLQPLLKCKRLIYLYIEKCKVKDREFFEILNSLTENNKEFISDIVCFA